MCFWCDEKYEPGHKCKGKKPQLYHLEVEGSDSEDMGEEELEQVTQCAHISLQALDGASTCQTMRVTRYHGKKPLQLLLDSGSTHNFIDTDVALRLDCQVETIPSLWVKVADGGQL